MLSENGGMCVRPRVNFANKTDHESKFILLAFCFIFNTIFAVFSEATDGPMAFFEGDDKPFNWIPAHPTDVYISAGNRSFELTCSSREEQLIECGTEDISR